MAKYDFEPSPDRLPSDQPAENSSGYGSDLSARPSAGVVENLPAENTTQVGKVLADDDLLAAMTSISAEALANIDQTLDQLTSSTDLFDIPAIDIDA